MRVRKIKEMAILMYLKKNANGDCITNISKCTGIGRPLVKELCFHLLGEKRIDVRVDETDKNYNTLIFFNRGS
jgi:hypothetical protein